MFSVGALSACNQNNLNKPEADKPNVILIMTDDQGWGEVGYYDHPLLKTPNIDAMAANGLRFDRFYAGAPVCSPTRASIITGRTNDRTGVFTHGHPLRKQEKSLAEAMQKAGYATGHFGKWHLNGLRGPGAPILAEDEYGPGGFGFEKWISVTNFFDIDPIMGEMGKIKGFTGTSSDIIVNQAIEFMEESIQKDKPFFAVVWDGSPHRPFVAYEEDKKPFEQIRDSVPDYLKGYKYITENNPEHFGEIVAFDRALGTLRAKLKQLDIAGNTLVWFCSDNGGLWGVVPTPVAHLRGFKGKLYEGGIRVPAIIEWPGKIKSGITNYPASTMDIFPTLLDILGLPDSLMTQPYDGQSITSVFDDPENEREKPIPFRFLGKAALVDNSFKLYTEDIDSSKFALYNLKEDPSETTDVASKYPGKFKQMKQAFLQVNTSIEKSVEGADYPEGKVLQVPERHFWTEDSRYAPYLEPLSAVLLPTTCRSIKSGMVWKSITFRCKMNPRPTLNGEAACIQRRNFANWLMLSVNGWRKTELM